MRIAWRTVGSICQRVAAEAQQTVDLLAGLKRIGIDDISHRKGHRYLTIVVDHDTGRLVWAAAGRDRATVEAFLDAHGEERAPRSSWCPATWRAGIAGPVAERLPNAVRCVDPFHVVALATDALDQVRREVWNAARQAGQRQLARDLKGARFALWKNPENLTTRQQTRLREIEQTNKPLYQAHLLKEHLRQIYRLPVDHALNLLAAWLEWARDSKLTPFQRLADTITEQRAGIEAAIRHHLSNARVEAINTQIRPITRRAFGFHNPNALIALAMLSPADLCPPLPHWINDSHHPRKRQENRKWTVDHSSGSGWETGVEYARTRDGGGRHGQEWKPGPSEGRERASSGPIQGGDRRADGQPPAGQAGPRRSGPRPAAWALGAPQGRPAPVGPGESSAAAATAGGEPSSAVAVAVRAGSFAPSAVSLPAVITGPAPGLAGMRLGTELALTGARTAAAGVSRPVGPRLEDQRRRVNEADPWSSPLSPTGSGLLYQRWAATGARPGRCIDGELHVRRLPGAERPEPASALVSAPVRNWPPSPVEIWGLAEAAGLRR
jgi:transposase